MHKVLTEKFTPTVWLFLAAVILLTLAGCGKTVPELPNAYFKDIPFPSGITIQAWDISIDGSDENPLLKTDVIFRTFEDIEQVVKFYDKKLPKAKKETFGDSCHYIMTRDDGSGLEMKIETSTYQDKPISKVTIFVTDIPIKKGLLLPQDDLYKSFEPMFIRGKIAVLLAGWAQDVAPDDKFITWYSTETYDDYVEAYKAHLGELGTVDIWRVDIDDAGFPYTDLVVTLPPGTYDGVKVEHEIAVDVSIGGTDKIWGGKQYHSTVSLLVKPMTEFSLEEH